ncbi:methylated-DNA--[protein]-cysteine S-methyltransferase [Paeniglutamicibacter sp. ABSL32-1]|uniref:methylated-DNA--[protein]-cysteine S-methyltransferase n=1 Tax=Paeniglutamicibacter quisquiliarum TaxID=2849498 RepID=UPI001C2D8315|nr:methylated-DNA--[protein]-cysteine S-methyltransferase [Paeniglutamicibacter quisquiliarum]MBV1778963.1 methylated-DNA--[protein]-cysteine S-methyltransferase [Paeniglutamicibacter quisquiliarum]
MSELAMHEMDVLRQQLAERAAAEGLIDVSYRLVDSPLGQLLLAATERGIVRVAFAAEDFDAVLGTLAEKVGVRVLHRAAPLDAAAAQLDEYFGHARRGFELSLDHRLSSGYRLEVQLALPSIGYGHTVSYKELAATTGRPAAVRAVGTACATNPLPIVVPCHRVLRSDGSLGGYLGGLEAKKVLLDLERDRGTGGE